MVQQNPRTAPRQPLTKHSSELSLRTFSLNVTKLDRYFDGNNYVNHNPRIADGVDHLRDRLLSTTRTPFRFDTVRMVLGEGGFVLVVTEGTFGDRNTSFYELFRVQSGKIAERWDVVEEVVPAGRIKEHKWQVLKTGTTRREYLGTTQQMKLLSWSQVVGSCF